MDFLYQIQKKSPLIHMISNYVTATDTANALLAIGASPVMSDDPSEVEEVTAIADALVLNMGTFSPAHAEAMLLAGKKAKSMGKSVILDPVGVGISRLRREAAKHILEEIGPDIVKGNFSEMAFLAGEESRSRGVDVSEEDARKDGLSIALKVYQKWGCVAAVTGKTDIVVFQNKAVEIHNGHPALKKMTGTGCITGGIIGAFLCIEDAFSAAVHGLMLVGLCGEKGYEKAGHLGSGSFHRAFMDALSDWTAEELEKRGKISEIRL